MNRKSILAAILAMALCLSATGADKEKIKTYSGEIADSQCALNVHSLTRSHEEMLKSKSMGGTSRNCTSVLHSIPGRRFRAVVQERCFSSG